MNTTGDPIPDCPSRDVRPDLDDLAGIITPANGVPRRDVRKVHVIRLPGASGANKERRVKRMVRYGLDDQKTMG